MKIATFDVDAQKGFTPLCPDELPVAGGHEIVASLNEMALRGAIRVGSKDAHAPNAVWVVEDAAQMLQPLPHANADLTWVRHCVPGTRGFELLDGLPAPIDYDFFVWKGVEPDLHPYGACFHDLACRRSTGVIEYLAAAGVGAVLVGGLALDFCVKNTALQLRAAGFQVLLYLPACRAISDDGAASAIAEMAGRGIIICQDAGALDRELARLEDNDNE